MSNEVEFVHFIDRYSRPVGDVVTLAAKIKTPASSVFLVVFHERATLEGWDAIEIRRVDEDGELLCCEANDAGEVISWLQDKHDDDTFASELFGDLTGSYPYQIKESINGRVTRHYGRKDSLEQLGITVSKGGKS